MTAMDIDEALAAYDTHHDNLEGVCPQCYELGAALFNSEKFKADLDNWVKIMRRSGGTGSPALQTSVLMAIKWGIGVGMQLRAKETK